MRTRRALAGAAFAALGLTLVLQLRAAVGVVRAGSDALLAAETSAAVALWEGGSRDAVERLLSGRIHVEDGAPAGVDRPVISGDAATAALYDADGWDAQATLRVDRRPDSRPVLPPSVVLLALLSTLPLLAAAWLGTEARRRILGTVLAAVTLAVPLLAARGWTEDALARLTDLRLDVAAQALAISGIEDARAAAPGAVNRITGLPLLQRAVAAERVVATTLLPETAEALAAAPAGAPSNVSATLRASAVRAHPRVTIDAVPYAFRDQGAFRLAMVPLEHTEDPLAPMVGIVLAGLLLAALPGALAPLAGAPRTLRRNLWAWSFLAPATAHLALFTLGPLAFAAWLSLHRWNLVDVARPFVGLGNYTALLRDGSFWSALLNTAVFTLHVPVAMAIALGFALLVHRRTRSIVLVRAALFLPSITSLVAIAVVWQWILNADYGILNWLLGLVGIAPVRWLTSPSTALVSIMILSTWMVVGYQMVLFQAGLAAIPEELYEAARIDGASPWRRFWHVTLPGLRHTLFFVLVTSIIGSFQIFGAVYVMTEGGPLGATDVAVYHIYKEAWEFLRFGSAAAQSWVLFAVIFAVTWLHFRFLERGRDEAIPSGHGVAR